MKKSDERPEGSYQKRKKPTMSTSTRTAKSSAAIRKVTQFIPGKKLLKKYMGPYEITKIKRNERYDVKNSEEFQGPKETSTSEGIRFDCTRRNMFKHEFKCTCIYIHTGKLMAN